MLKQLPAQGKGGGVNQMASLYSWLHHIIGYRLFLFHINNYISSKATYNWVR